MDFVRILGARGSVPVAGVDFQKYGQATTCVLLSLGGQRLVVDGGTGLLRVGQFLPEGERDLTILLTHCHLDHLLGLPMCPLVFRRETRLRVYGATRNGLTAADQVKALMAPPLWPVGPEQLPCIVDFRELTPRLRIGPLTVDSLEAPHPGGVSLLRITDGSKTVVVCTDFTLTEANRPRLLDFAKDCDLLLCDGQYSPEEWGRCAHFGHNNWQQAAAFARDCGAKQARIIHHDPTHTDQRLDLAAGQLQAICGRCSFALAEEEILL